MDCIDSSRPSLWAIHFLLLLLQFKYDKDKKKISWFHFVFHIGQSMRRGYHMQVDIYDDFVSGQKYLYYSIFQL